MRTSWMIVALVCVGVGCSENASWAQSANAADPMKVIARDAGSWKCKVKMWMDPNGQPEEMEGEEVNRMLGI